VLGVHAGWRDRAALPGWEGWPLRGEKEQAFDAVQGWPLILDKLAEPDVGRQQGPLHMLQEWDLSRLGCTTRREWHGS